MRTFIDLGTHFFEGLAEFTQKLGITKEWNVYSYEGCRDLYEETQSIRASIQDKYNELHHYNCAVLDYSGTVVFNKIIHLKNEQTGEITKDYFGAANCLEENITQDSGYSWIPVKEEVKCVDINDVFHTIVTKDPQAEIYIKIDIEGSEFKVLPRLAKSNYLHHIKEMHVEWHERFWNSNPIEYAKKCEHKYQLIQFFSLNKIPIIDHH